MHSVGAERFHRERRRHCGVDPAGNADHDVAEPVLAHVVAEAELERQPHLLELRLERNDTAVEAVAVRPGRAHGADVDDLHRRRRLALAGERAPANVAQPPSDHGFRVEIDEQQLLLEADSTRDDLPLVVDHAGMAVEDQLVLPAHCVAERHEACVVACASHEHLLALDFLPDVERRRAHVHEQLGARQRQVGRRRPRLPHVLADRHADERLADLEQDEIAPRREIALFVEDSVVRQEPLAVDRLHVAVRADRARVEEIRVEVGEADQRDDPSGLLRDLAQRPLRRADEARAQEQVLRRVAGHRELREEREVGALVARLAEAGEDQVAIPLEVADDGVDLREREPHRFRLTV